MTIITIPSSAAARVGQLVRLLGSDRSGEVVAAAAAIRRTLRAAGLDLDAFANVTEKALTLAPSAPQDAAGFAIGPVIRFCWRRCDALGEREQGFVESLYRLAHRLGDDRLELSPRQEAWLLDIFERLKEMR